MKKAIFLLLYCLVLIATYIHYENLKDPLLLALEGKHYLTDPPQEKVEQYLQKHELFEATKTYYGVKFKDLIDRAQQPSLQLMLDGGEDNDIAYYLDKDNILANYTVSPNGLKSLKKQSPLDYWAFMAMIDDLRKIYPGEFPKGSNPPRPEIQKQLQDITNKMYASAGGITLISLIILLSQFKRNRQNL